MTTYTSSFGPLGGNKHPKVITTKKAKNKIFPLELKSSSNTRRKFPWPSSARKELTAWTLVGRPKRKRKNREDFFVIHYCLLKAVCLVVIFSSSSITQACPGRFVNPLTGTCWFCLFPPSKEERVPVFPILLSKATFKNPSAYNDCASQDKEKNR